MTEIHNRYDRGIRVLRPDGEQVRGLVAWISAIPKDFRKKIVEVGSWRGESAVMFSSEFDRVFCVDSWRDYELQYQEFLRVTGPIQNIAYQRAASVDAAQGIAAASVDAVYIDANHQYASVRADIDAWLPKVRPGGYIGGHDYGLAYQGVKMAVDETFGAQNVRRFEDSSWLVGPLPVAL